MRKLSKEKKLNRLEKAALNYARAKLEVEGFRVAREYARAFQLLKTSLSSARRALERAATSFASAKEKA